MYLRIAIVLCMIAVPAVMPGQNVNKVNYPAFAESTRMEVRIPTQINGYKALKADLHTHTYFSDGSVSPEMRVDEAWKTGLDVLAITDHIEYKTNREYINSQDDNTSYHLARKRAEEKGIVLIKGTEITRKQPIYGHFNALFITDVNKIKVDDPKAAIAEALAQGGFVFWNHPAWAVDTCQIHPFQEDLLKNNMIHGIEVFNNNEFYPRALKWAHEKKLTIISSSDVHTSVYTNDGIHGAGCAVSAPYHRPMTIILAKDSSQEAIKEALLQRRTLAYFGGHLAGEPGLLTDFFLASVSVAPVAQTETDITYRLTNGYDIPFRMSYGKTNVLLAAGRSVDVKVKKDVSTLEIKLPNVFIDEFVELTVKLKLKK